MVKKEVFEWIRTGQKNIELRIGKAKKGDVAVFQCGRNILRRKIIKREEGNLTGVLRKDNYKKIIPSAHSLEEAVNYIKKLYETTEGVFTAYYFETILAREKIIFLCVHMIQICRGGKPAPAERHSCRCFLNSSLTNNNSGLLLSAGAPAA